MSWRRLTPFKDKCAPIYILVTQSSACVARLLLDNAATCKTGHAVLKKMVNASLGGKRGGLLHASPLGDAQQTEGLNACMLQQASKTPKPVAGRAWQLHQHSYVNKATPTDY